jgi:hypothetical protein
MVIFIPVCADQKHPDVPLDLPTRKKAIVYIRNAHNHPMHPKTKPSSEDKVQVKKAMEAAGRRGLTVQKLLNGEPCHSWHAFDINLFPAPSTSAIYDGQRLSIASPAYMDRRKLRKEIHNYKTEDYPKGMGWEGFYYI